MARKRKNTTGLPDPELDSIARVLYSSIIEYCNSEKGKKDYAEWQKQRQLNIKNQKNVAPNHRSIVYEVLDRKRR